MQDELAGRTDRVLERVARSCAAMDDGGRRMEYVVSFLEEAASQMTLDEVRNKGRRFITDGELCRAHGDLQGWSLCVAVGRALLVVAERRAQNNPLQ